MGVRETTAGHGGRRRSGAPAKPTRRGPRPEEPRATRRAENARATRRALVREARRLFTRHGYAEVSLEQICARARVTKGALYHHFRDKRDLFRTVCREVEELWVAEALAAASAERDPLGRLQLGCQASLDGCLDPTVQRVLLLDGPAVLDWDELRQLDSHRGLGLMRTALEDAMEAGQLERQPREPLARLILGALTEASLAIARDADPARARRQMGLALERLIDGLAPHDQPASSGG